MPSEQLSSEHLEDLVDPAAPARGLAGLGPGTRLGRYELVASIATGRMATVWAARLFGDRGFSKLVAVKTILPQLAREPLFEQMFLDEARIASGIHHPNVCEIYEFGEDRRRLYLAMEWISGESLASLLESGGASTPSPLAPRIAARIIADACAGLSAAHDRAIVHRDISAQNVLVGENGTVKLADFGVAKALDRSQETSSGFLKGKLAYTAPEYIESGRADRRTDVFSMGVVLYEATLGVLPFTGDRDAAVMAAIMRGEPGRPRDLAASYPRELEAIVLRALARDPDARFESAEALGRALEEWLARSGPPIMQSAVTKLVASRVGARLDERRAQLRETMRLLDEPPARALIQPPRLPPAMQLPAMHLPAMQPMTPEPPNGGAFSSYPPAPLAFAPPPPDTWRRQRPRGTRPVTPLILAGVGLVMCSVLGVVGGQVIRRPTRSASEAPSERALRRGRSYGAGGVVRAPRRPGPRTSRDRRRDSDADRAWRRVRDSRRPRRADDPLRRVRPCARAVPLGPLRRE